MKPFTRMKTVRNERKFSRKTYAIMALWVFAAMTYLLRVVLNNRLATMGEQLADYRIKSEELRTENQILTNDLASYSALRYIEKKAKAMGLKPATQWEYYK